MKYSTRLDSAVFQLTPTRTRCDLVICANGKTEKIASGLVNPFLAHLKAARDQMAKGGYSITFELENGSDAMWFTKGTIERFVRFVSTPEVLERVYTLESEILQIEEAIAIQTNNDVGLSAIDDRQAKPAEHIEGGKLLIDSNEEKAIVLYKPGMHPSEANGSIVQEGNSKIQLMKVLETRKTVLQKEQGMAFARAVAAGFDIDHLKPLMSFAESFGASRLMDACVRFMELWKRKHETGQWVDVEAAEAMSSRSDFAATNGSGIVFANAVNKQWPETPDSNGRAGVQPIAALKTEANMRENCGKQSRLRIRDEKHSMLQQLPPGHQQYIQGQLPHPIFPPWSMHSPPGAVPVFQGYPMQGIPYYQNYPGNSPVFQPPCPSEEDPRLSTGQKMGQRKHSMDSNTEIETWEGDTLKVISQDEVELEKETSGSRELGTKSSRSAKTHSGMVVIRNLNYITSKRQVSSSSEQQSTSGPETDEENGDQFVATPYTQHRKSLRASKRKESDTKSLDKLNSSDKERTGYGKEEDSGHWQAFQNYLLKDADEAECAFDQGMLAMEKEARVKWRQHTVGDDPLAMNGQDLGGTQEGNRTDAQNVIGDLTRMARASKDESLISRRMGQSNDSRRFMDVHSAEIDAGRGGHRRSTTDDFIIRRRGFASSPSDPLAVNGFEHANNDLDRRSPPNIVDDSYIISLRSTSLDHVGTDGTNVIFMDSEFPSSGQRAENQVKYEPDDFSLKPEHGTGRGSIAYDLALDYDTQVCAESDVLLNKKNKKAVPIKSNKDQKSKLIPDASERRKTIGPIRKGKPSKLNPLDEVRARAERLRTFKADLLKMKKEREEEEIKRLEALKLARQKRIAARGSSIPAQSISQQTRKQLPTKLSPGSHKGSKFTDSETGASSPRQRLPIKHVSAGSSGGSLKASKSSKLSTGSHSAGNRLSRSSSSPESKKVNGGVTPDTKLSMVQTRRLSEPKIRGSHLVSSIKPRKAEAISKPKVSSEPESKKMSAIMNHDKSKAASLPELKIRTTKGRDITLGKSAKQIPQKVNGGATTSEGGGLKMNNHRNSHHSDGDDNPVIDKTVVMLEPEPSIPNLHTSEKSMGIQVGHSHSYQVGEKAETTSDYAAIRAPVSSVTIGRDGVDRLHTENQLQKQHEAIIENANKMEESVKLSSIHSTERQCKAPYARVSSFEDPHTGKSEYGKAPPASLQLVTQGVDGGTLKAHVPDSKSLKLEKIPETLDKPQAKESSRGFRRLLKFARKSHTAGESDNINVNGSEADEGVANISSSSEVHTLKNLISQDETPTASGTPQKSSRHFSILSPFRTKTCEKN